MGEFITPIESLERRQLLSAITRVDSNSTAATPDGVTWDTAFADLQQALAAAVAGDEIRLADGTYKPTSGADRTISFQLKNDVSVYGGYAGIGEASPDQRDIAAFPTILSGDIGLANATSDNSYHVVNGTNLSAATLFDGLTITQGRSDGATQDQVKGGGMYLVGSAMTIQRCLFFQNITGGLGGGLCSDGPSAINVENCTFSQNTDVSIGNITQGGGLFVGGTGSRIEGCIFTDNVVAFRGGAISVSSSATVIGCTFTKNIAAGGGAMDLSGSCTISNCRFMANHATISGGAIYTFASGPITNCTFVGNSSANRGGAIYAPGAITLANSTLVSNSATSTGGAIFLANGGQQIVNDVLWNNAAPNSSQLNGTGASYCDVQGGFPGTGNIDGDPQFVRNPSPGADNTWGTADDDYGDLRLQITSPCIDAGDNTAVPAGVTTDIAGRNRFFDFPGVNNGAGAVVDMGANELDLRLGLLRVAAGQTLALPAGGHTFFVERFDLQPNATLDLRDDSLIIDYSGASELAATQLLINSARDGGAWNGIGITSTSAKNNPLHNTTLGAMEASDFKSIYGTAALFGGHAIDSTAVLVKYTYYGDANFNGVVNFDDYARIDNGFLNNRTGWLNGDFDGNGGVNFDDYSLIDLAFNTQGSALRADRSRAARK